MKKEKTIILHRARKYVKKLRKLGDNYEVILDSLKINYPSLTVEDVVGIMNCL